MPRANPPRQSAFMQGICLTQENLLHPWYPQVGMDHLLLLDHGGRATQSCPELSGGEAFFVTSLVACSTGEACTMIGSFLVPSSGAGV